MNYSEIAHPKPKHTGSKQLFGNQYLEKLTRTHIAVPVSLFFLYGAALLVWSLTNTSVPTALVLALFPIGFLTFTLFEYLVHRHLYHITPSSESRARLQYKVHGVHHEYPKDKERLAMPPWITLAIYTLLLKGFHLAFGNAAFAFFAGFLVGYASYLLVHYAVHAFAPPHNRFKVLWVNHAVHHYKDQNTAFGVSSPLWDYVFGTMPPSTPAEAQRPARKVVESPMAPPSTTRQAGVAA